MDTYICKNCGNFVKLKYDKFLGQFLWVQCPQCGLYKLRKIIVKGGELKAMRKYKFYSVNELAKIIDRTPGMVRYWVFRGAIPFYQIGGRVLFRDDDLEDIKWFVEIQGQKRGVKECKKE